MAADRYRFGDHVFDAARGVLAGPDGPVPLRPKSFALLQYLLGKDALIASARCEHSAGATRVTSTACAIAHDSAAIL